MDTRISVSGADLQCQVSGTGRAPGPATPGAPSPEALKPPSAAGRAIVQAHGGRLLFQEKPSGFQATLKLPILSADDFFYERVRQIHEASVAKAADFSLLRLHLPSWTALRNTLGEDPAKTLWSQLLQIVTQALRNESDFAMQTRQNLWLALPGARAEDAQAVADRIQTRLREQTAGSLPMPVELPP